MSEAAAPAAANAAASTGAAAPAAAEAAAPTATATPSPAPAAPATAPAPSPAPETQDIASLPEWAQQIIRNAQQQPAQQAPTAPQAPAPVTPTTADGDVTRLPRWAQQAVTDGQQAARQLAIQSAVIQAAPAAGADVARLLDSQAAMRALSAVDPNDAAAVQQAITNTLATHPHLAAAVTGPARGGAEFGSHASSEVTPQQFAQMSYAERAALYQNDPDTYRRLAAGS